MKKSPLHLIVDLLEKIGPEHKTEIEEIRVALKGCALPEPNGYCVPQCFAGVEGFTAALAGWIEARKLKKNPPTGRAIQILINRVAERPDDAIAALDMAAERGWSTMKWEWFDREQPASKRRGEYKENGRLPILEV